MSQYSIAINTGDLPPQVATSYVTDNGTAIPSLNVLNVKGLVNIKTVGSSNNLTIRSDIITYIQPGAYPYTALANDYYISVDTSLARTIDLPNAPTTGKTYVIKDRTGNANSNNITVTTLGGTVLIDGSTSTIVNEDYDSIEVVFNGTSYEIF